MLKLKPEHGIIPDPKLELLSLPPYPESLSKTPLLWPLFGHEDGSVTGSHRSSRAPSCMACFIHPSTYSRFSSTTAALIPTSSRSLRSSFHTSGESMVCATSGAVTTEPSRREACTSATNLDSFLLMRAVDALLFCSQEGQSAQVLGASYIFCHFEAKREALVWVGGSYLTMATFHAVSMLTELTSLPLTSARSFSPNRIRSHVRCACVPKLSYLA